MATTKRRRPTASESLFSELGFSPVEAENLRVRSNLMITLSQRIGQMGWTQVEAARHLDVTQPRISDLVRGKIDRFSVDTLIAMLGAAGVEVNVSARLMRASA